MIYNLVEAANPPNGPRAAALAYIEAVAKLRGWAVEEPAKESAA